MRRQTYWGGIGLLALTLPVLFYSSEVVKAQGPPTGPAGGNLAGTYPNPVLAADRVRKTGDTMTGALNITIPAPGSAPGLNIAMPTNTSAPGLNISMPNGPGLIAPFTLSGLGNTGPNRGIAFPFNLPTSAGGSALGAQMVAAREGWGFHSYFSFNTHNGTAVTEAVRITSGGRVGIGNSAPANQLHISNGSGAATFLVGGSGLGVVNVQDTAAAVDSKMYQWRSEGGVFRMALINDAWSTFVQQNLLVATSTGNIGMGTASPTAKLDVAGQIRSSTGGFKFPDGTVQTTAAIGGGGSSGWIDGGTIVNLTNSSAKVGIGTPTPQQRLQIGSNTETSTTTPDAISLGATYSSVARANPKLRLFDSAGGVYGMGVSLAQFDFMAPVGTRYVWSVNGIERMRLSDVGTITVTGDIEASGTIKAKYQDVAEWVESSQSLMAGTVVVLDQTKSNQVIASTQAYDTKVAGVISPQPGITLGETGEKKVLVATTGRVKIKVDATSAPIQVGDLLVTGDREGFAMKSLPLSIGGVQLHRPGTLVGKALEPLAKGTGEILVLLSLQ